MWNVIGTGLVAGLIASMTNILIAHLSNRTQREITKMLNLEKTNEVTLEWNNETRDLIVSLSKRVFRLIKSTMQPIV